jgi:acyl-CoA synthetase (AMP-forming)/AMP-acid ligase II
MMDTQQPRSASAAFAKIAARLPANPFLYVTEETARPYDIPPGAVTYSEAASQIAQLRARYAAAGYGTGHRVGLMLNNRPSFFFHWLALNALGSAVVPLNSDLRPAELSYLIDHSNIVLGIAAAPHLAALRVAAPALAAIADEAWPPPAPNPARNQSADLTTECALLYTSGTTGRPKGCVLSNDYYLRVGHWYAEVGGLCALRQGDRLITPLPLTHMNAMAYSTMAMIVTGGCIVQLDRFHPRTWWDAVRESQATIVHYLGVMPSMLLGAAAEANDCDHRVRFGFGAGVDRRHHGAFEDRFGFPLLEAWAMTETGAGAVIIANREPRKVGTNCFGRPEPAIELRIMPPDGELLVRAAGPDPRAGFFSEYLKDPEATEAAWAGGWFHTGDIVRADANGYLTFVDRKKNVIRRSGENIGAVEVESVLRRHPLVAEVAVAAVADDIRGEEVLACIVLRAPTADPAEAAADIVRTARGDLSYFKVPGWIAFVDSLPLTASQKVARGELKALAHRLVESPGCIDTRGLKRR